MLQLEKKTTLYH